jgi:hypothetical protein
MTTSLVLYGTTTASTTLSTANKLVTSTGGTSTSKTTTASDNAGTNQYYMEVFSQGGTAGDSASITAPTGKGWLFDVTTLETNTIDAGNWSAVLKMNDTAGFTAITMIIRAYVYNGGTYTAISTMQVTGQSMSSTSTTYNIANTAFSAQAFNTGDKLYIDLWLKPTTGHWAGDPIVNFSSSSSSAGVTGQFAITTPGYDPTAVTNTWTANDVGLTPSDSMTIVPATSVVFPADTLTCSDSIVNGGQVPLSDSATGITESATFTVVAVPVDTLTCSDSILSAPNVANTVVSLSTFDTIVPTYVYLTYYFLLDVPPPTLSDTVLAAVSYVPTETSTSSDTAFSVSAVFGQDALTETEAGTFQPQFVDSVATGEYLATTVSISQSDTPLSVSETVLYTIVDVPTDNVSTSDTFAQSSVSTSNFVADSLVADDSMSVFVLSSALSDVPLTVIDAAINPTMTVLEQMVQTESYVLIGNPVLADTALSVVDQTMSNVLSVSLSDVLSTTDSVSGVSQLITGYATKTYDYDNFTRATSSGVMGTADSGSAWTFRDNTNNTFNVTGTYLQVKASTAPGSFDNYLGTTFVVDCDVTVSFKFTSLDLSLAKVFGRGSATTAHISAGFQDTGTFVLGNDGNSTATGTTAVTLVANTKYFVRLCIQGNFVGAKYWANGTAEPAAWTIQGTQTTYTGAGYCGFYVNAATTTNYIQVDDYAIRDYRLADSTGLPIPPDVYALSMSETFPVDTATTSDILVGQSTIVVSISDIVLSTSDTMQDTIVCVQTDSGTTSDSLYYLSFHPTMTITDVLSIDDSASTLSIARTFVSDSVSLSDVFVPTNNPSPVDVLSSVETLSDPVSVSLSDTTVPTDSGVGIFSRAYILSDNGSEFVLSDSISSFVSSYSYIEVSSVTEVTTFGVNNLLQDVTTPSQDNLFATSPAPLPDIALLPSDGIASNPALSDTAQLTESEVNTIISIKLLSDQVTASDAWLFAEQINDTTNQLTTSDAIINGVPSNFTADALTLTDSIDHGGLFPFIDQLDSPTDFLGVRTNFTDNLAVFDSIVVTQSNALLDARSVLYTNTITDAPSAYYQLNENHFGGLYQKDGNDQPNNSSNPSLIGATLEYTWAQLEPQEGNRLFSLVDADILPWKNQAKRVIIRVSPSNIANNNNTHNGQTAGSATPAWVYGAGAPSVTSPLDGTTYPVYWNAVFTQKFTAFVQALGLYYDTTSTVSGVVVSLGVRGTTSLEASGDSAGNTLALWAPVGYTPTQWVTSINWAINTYQQYFVHTPLILSVNSAFISPDTIYNMDTMISIAVTQGVWLMDENVYVGEAHNNPNWNIVPLMSVPAYPAATGPDTLVGDLSLSLDYQSSYTSVWAADITNKTQPTLTAYAALVAQKGLSDSAPSGYKMQIIGGVYPTSHISTGDYLNGAQQFDGITGYGLIQNGAQTTTSAWTLKATVYPTVLPTQEAIIFSVGRDGTSGFGGYALGVSGGSAGGAGSNFCAFFPGFGWLDSGYAFPQSNQWYSLFCTWDGVTLSFFVNGVQTPNTYNTAAFTPQADMTIGAIWDGMTRLPKRFFIGSIDEVATYPYNLTQSRITAYSSAEIGLSDGGSGSTGVVNLSDQVTVDDSLSNFTDIRLYTDTALSTSDLITSHNTSTNVAAYNVLALDNFNRTVAAGSIGVETDGKTWSRLQGTSTISVDGTRAVITGTSTLNIFSVVGTSGTQEEGVVRFSSSVNTSAAGITFRTLDGNNFYVLRYSGGALQLVKYIANVATAMATLTIATTANTKYWLRFRAYGSSLQGMMWTDGATEGTAWQIAATDTTYTSGGVGMYALPTVSTNVWIDQLYVIDNPLTDFVLVGDSLLIGVAPVPFVDATVTPADVSMLAVTQLNEDDGTETETSYTAVNAMGLDFLLYTPAPLTEVIAYNPVDQMTAADVVYTPVAVNLPAENTAAPTDSIVFTPNWLGVSFLAPSDFFSEAISSTLSDTPTLFDATTETGVNLFTDSVSTSDSMVFNGVMLDNIMQTLSDSVSDVLAFVPTDLTPVSEVETTSVSVSQTDVALFPGDVLAVQTLFVPVDNPVQIETIVSALSQTYSFTNATPTDNVSDILSSVLSDQTTSSDTIFDVYALSLSDQFVPSDVGQEIDIFLGQDIAMSSSETLLSTVGQTVSDALSMSETLSDTDVYVLVDALNETDALSVLSIDMFLPDVPLTTDSILVSISESVGDAPLSTSEVTLTNVVQTIADTLTFTDSNVYALSLSQTDTLSFGETQIDIVYQLETDSVSTSDIFTYTQIFVPVDTPVLVETLLILASTSLSDTPTVQEVLLSTVTDFATDTTIPGADSIVKGDLFAFEDDLGETETIAFVSVKSFEVDNISPSDTITASSAGTFTGWLDLNNVNENAVYVTNLAPTDSQSEIETLFVADSETVQDSSTPSTESFVIALSTPALDANAINETVLIMETVADNYMLTQVEISVMAVQPVPIDAVLSSDSLSLSLSQARTDSEIPLDASTVTIGAADSGVLSLVDAQAYTVIPVLVDAMAQTEGVTVLLAEMVPADVLTMIEGRTTIGYTFKPDSLSVVEAGQFQRIAYIKTVALINTSTVSGVITRGNLDAIVRTGIVEGELP